MGSATPKQYLAVGSKPLIVRTLESLDRCPDIDGLVLAVPSDRISETLVLVRTHGLRKVWNTVAGGAERQDSVQNALAVLPEGAGWVVVHDAVRPFVSVGKISETIRAAKAFGAAVLAVPSTDTVKQAEDGWVVGTLDRGKLWRVQTPQAFRRDWLVEAYGRAAQDGYRSTDDAALVERIGHPVRIVEGEIQNIKITSREDLILAEAYCREEKP